MSGDRAANIAPLMSKAMAVSMPKASTPRIFMLVSRDRKAPSGSHSTTLEVTEV